MHGSSCETDDDCLEGTVLEAGNGPYTGRCVNNTYDETGTTKQCEIRGWCPVELEDDEIT